MDVHVTPMWEVDRRAGRGPFIDVVAVGVVEMTVVEEVEMVVVGDLRVAAPAVMQVGMGGVRIVGLVGGPGSVERHGRRHGGTSPAPMHGTVSDARRSVAVARRSSWAAR